MLTLPDERLSLLHEVGRRWDGVDSALVVVTLPSAERSYTSQKAEHAIRISDNLIVAKS